MKNRADSGQGSELASHILAFSIQAGRILEQHLKWQPKSHYFIIAFIYPQILILRSELQKDFLASVQKTREKIVHLNDDVCVL